MEISNSEKKLIEILDNIITNYGLDAIVVEGYDGVGKSRILNILSDRLGVTPYRPDYNLWQKYDHRPQDRWKVSGFFWDVCSHFNLKSKVPLLFDRGVISGAVYNDDINIAKDYKQFIRGRSIIHILVTCSEEDYYKFNEARGSKEFLDYATCQIYTERYKKFLEESGVYWFIHENRYLEEADIMKYICAGCGHYSYGICRHPSINNEVDGNLTRCLLSSDKEVQDEYSAEMHVM